MPTFLSLASFKTRIISYLVIYLISLMGMWRNPFLDLFTTDSTYNFDKYSNKQYDELIYKVKTDLADDKKARWEAMKQAEKILIEDGAVAPIYHQGR